MHFYFLLLCFILPLQFVAQVPPASSAACAENSRWTSTISGQLYDCECIVGHSPSCTPASTNSAVSTAPDPAVVITGMIFQSLINSMLTSNAQSEKEKQEAQQAELMRIAAINAEKKRIQDSIALAKHQELMGAYKPLDGTSLNSDPYSFKTLDGEMEAIRKNAEDQFGNASFDEMAVHLSQGTNFFGTMSDSDIQILFDPMSDPMVVDLRESVEYIEKTSTPEGVVQNLKESDPVVNNNKLPVETCNALRTTMQRDISNRNAYLKTTNTTLAAVQEWQDINNKAMLDAFTEGLNYITGSLLEQVNAKKDKATLLKKTMEEILKKEPNNVGAKNLISFLDKNYLDDNWRSSVINGYKKYSELINTKKKLVGYYNLTCDALKNTLDGLSSVDQELMTMLQDPSIKSFLNDKAFMNSCVFIGVDVILKTFVSSEKVNKALNGMFNNKIPYVAIAQTAVNSAYNAFAFGLSWNMLKELNQVHGKELETAQMLQDRIFTNQLKLNHQCSHSF